LAPRAASCSKHRQDVLKHNIGLAESAEVIVIVDDDAGARSSLEFLLESYGFECATFDSAEELLARYDGLNTRCGIFDVHLGAANGIDVYSALTARGRPLSAIFVSGHIDEKTRAEAARVNAVALLAKPFSDDALIDAVHRGLRPS
jgi:FixJ family two-component response regulator